MPAELDVDFYRLKNDLPGLTSSDPKSQEFQEWLSYVAKKIQTLYADLTNNSPLLKYP